MIKKTILQAKLIRKILKITNNTSNENIFGLADFLLGYVEPDKIQLASEMRVSGCICM